MEKASLPLSPARPRPRPQSNDSVFKRIALALLCATVLIPCAIILPGPRTGAALLRNLVLTQSPSQHPMSSSVPLNTTSAPLEVFQVYDDPLLSVTDPVASVVVMDHVFGFSYGRPFVGKYTPPNLDFNRVLFTLSATSKGRQFDRLALVFLGDHEIWRTSTAEPTANGIHFGYTKDLSHFLSLFKSDQKLIFEMGNLVDDTYTGAFHIILTATFYNDKLSDTPPDLILPISARRSTADKPSHFLLPQDSAAVQLSLPRSATKAVALITASGNAAEEFWYANIISSEKDAFPGESMLAHGPHREVGLYVDNKLVASTFAFPIIYTGGISPGFWRPIVGISAYDVPMYEFDITPALPLLWDGAKLEIKVLTGDALEPVIEHDWVVSGNVLVWTSPELTATAGKLVEFDISPLNVLNQVTKSTDNSELNVTSVASRSGKLSSEITYSNSAASSKPFKKIFSSEWALKSDNVQQYARSGQHQRVTAQTDISQSSSLLGARGLSYPLDLTTAYQLSPVLKITAELARGLTDDIDKQSSLWTHQSGSAYYIGQDAQGNGPFGGGETEQGFISGAVSGSQYWRTVRAVNGNVVRDLEVRHLADDEDSGALVDKDELMSDQDRDGDEFRSQVRPGNGENVMFSGCLDEYNQRVATSDVKINASEDEQLKKCIKRMFGRGPI
ncbi:peptide N-acetyl-beta-D-glucosaminyl asparaginase amidase A-domain-containing protein [Myxozyma melibiosi]|uniref:Peptide N-acetyl-beta-D-glucosaminyl asparaginase amidase A-domain-containing protein n=1 Tax=Myxozyma melibiosi TaxID=54550 RepID=A0ABR1F9Q1_9ASCO